MNDIRIGACDWALPGAGLYAPQIAAKAGLKALSLKVGLYENDYPITRPEMQKIYLEEQQRYGIEYCALALNDFDNIPMHAREDTKQHAIVWDLLERAAETAEVLGVPLIQVPGFAASEVKNEEDLQYSAKALRWLCDRAGEHGISVAAENLMLPDEFTHLYELVGRSNFYLYFDSQNYNVFRGCDERKILKALYVRMCNQIHVKDGKEMSGGLLGSGPSGFHETIRWLKEHHFTGYILLENYYDQLPLRTQAENPYDLLREDICTLRKALQ